MTSPILPNFVIAGTARSGTTSLYYYLRQHPDIGFPRIKEPKYFSSLDQTYPHTGPGDDTVDKLVIRNLEDYQGLFQDLGRYPRIGEASSDYLYFHRHTAARMRQILGDIPIILLLRNPIERAFSAYNNMLRDGRETLTFRDGLARESERLAENWDWMWAYGSGGLYAAQVETFLKVFSNVKVILFDDFQVNTPEVLHEIYTFLGVDTSFVADTSSRYSHSGKAKNRFIAFLSRRDNTVIYAMRRLAMRIAPRSFLEHLAGSSLEKETMSAADRAYLRQYFHDDIEKLENLLKLDLSRWS